MVVSKCPICNEALVGYAWTKTPKGKNWLKKGDTWHDCPKKQFKRKTARYNQKITEDYGPMVKTPNGWKREKLLNQTLDHDAHTLYYSSEKGDWYSPYYDDDGKSIRYSGDELDQAKDDGYTDIQDEWRAKE